ncbi:hypothetical protein DMJ13_20565 [halophilic archaeon]|nr:hypothetical protein DMJ13_20565 [halophilic archaeon]
MITDFTDQLEMIQRHLEILKLVLDQEPIGIVQLSHETNYARHEVRYSLRQLEEDNLITPSPQGALTTDQTTAFVEDLDERIENLQDRIAALKSNRKTAESTNNRSR